MSLLSFRAFVLQLNERRRFSFQEYSDLLMADWALNAALGSAALKASGDSRAALRTLRVGVVVIVRVVFR